MSITKETNPKDAIGSSRLPYSHLPWRALTGAVLAMLEGALKYRRHNYRIAGVRASVYFDACQRHVISWWEGEDQDPDSGLCHIDKAIASLLILRDGMLQGNWQDDRPPRVESFILEANEKAVRLIARVEDPQEPYTQLNIT